MLLLICNESFKYATLKKNLKQFILLISYYDENYQLKLFD